MKDRITKFLTDEQISSAEFADKIGVQRSSVSHVLNGRNYPSASFIQKMMSAYPKLNSRWLLLGEGEMFERKGGVHEPSLFDQPALQINLPPVKEHRSSSNLQKGGEVPEAKKETTSSEPIAKPDINQKPEADSFSQQLPVQAAIQHAVNKTVERIIVIYSDKTFHTYTPA